MAIIAILVFYGVTDLALKVINMLFMLRVAGSIRQDIFMAVLALDGHSMIPVTNNLTCAVEFRSVAFGACHCRLCPVDVGGEPGIIPQVLVANPGPVTGCAVILHGWGFFDNVV
jgi:hypothetical protein